MQTPLIYYRYNTRGQKRTMSLAQLEAFSTLIAQAKVLVEQSENSAEALTWLAISQSSTASAKGGLGALDFAESAKENLERAIEKEETVPWTLLKVRRKI